MTGKSRVNRGTDTVVFREVNYIHPKSKFERISLQGFDNGTIRLQLCLQKPEECQQLSEVYKSETCKPKGDYSFCNFEIYDENQLKRILQKLSENVDSTVKDISEDLLDTFRKPTPKHVRDAVVESTEFRDCRKKGWLMRY